MTKFQSEFEPLAQELQMKWQIRTLSERPRMAIFVSQHLHCLADILHRHQSGELQCDVPVIISDHVVGARARRVLGVKFGMSP